MAVLEKKKAKVEDKVQITISVNSTVERAFSKFVDEIEYWWPSKYSWSGDTLQRIYIEPREKGRCRELGPDNFVCDWGTVVKFRPAEKIHLLWQIGPSREPVPNPDNASIVKISFDKKNDSVTEVRLVHRDFSNHGDGWEQYVAGMGSSHGWSLLLDNYAAYVNDN